MLSSLNISFSFPLLKPQTIHYGSPKTINSKKRSHMKNYLSDNKTKPKNINSSVVYSPKRESDSERKKHGHGIGIARFLQGKNYLITGATGFLGKVFLEKMLRTAPDIGQIFVLIRAKDKDAALNRLKTEIIDSELLKSLEEVYGKNYKALVMSKLVAVPGCVCESDLGMDPFTANEIATKVNVLVNSAASTKFDDRYDVALNSNTKGPSHLLNFARTCNNICLFLHISTAYVSDGEEKIIQERPLCMGENNVSWKRNNISKNQKSVPRLDIDNEMRLATNPMDLVNDNEAAQEMKILGLERAKIHGWPNTYSFTKAMGEMMITSLKSDIPIAIVRPTVIGSTYKEPFPGWIEGNRMFDPFILSYGKGKLPGKVADPKAILDMVPVDMVVNAAIAVMAKHANSGNLDLTVYHFGSSMINPISFGDMVDYWYKHFKCCPLSDPKGNDISISKMKFFESIDAFSAFISSEMEKKSGLMEPISLEPNRYTKLILQCNKRARHFIQMARAYEPYTFYKGRFDIGNAQKLMEEMSMEEIREFWFDLGGINWEEYICSIHIPGLRKHVLKSNK
ncbi:fatty acyl-CoA reductase 2, chloroplastic-like [Prosopis cineraria]|uniref:fatty acyl-CoA reductase 2, chloroplastic-like n=1 Tax=Prosopis cineraria TaxID=364024 RepID=UPI0024106119|nr:fatty acyl-CoA reductase 2, chloroplastic-like [Prosopis cineraria]